MVPTEQAGRGHVPPSWKLCRGIGIYCPLEGHDLFQQLEVSAPVRGGRSAQLETPTSTGYCHVCGSASENTGCRCDALRSFAGLVNLAALFRLKSTNKSPPAADCTAGGSTACQTNNALRCLQR